MVKNVDSAGRGCVPGPWLCAGVREEVRDVKYQHQMPVDVREMCCAHVRGYERRRRELKARKGAAYLSGRPERGVDMLEGIQSSRDRESVVAVESAMIIALQGIKSREVRSYLRSGLLLNICNRKQYPYDRLYIPTVSKKEFYRRKNDFLLALAEELGYLEL